MIITFVIDSVLIEMASKQERLRESILHFFVENPNFDRRVAAKTLGVSVSTIYLVIKNYRSTGTTKRKIASGGDRKLNKKLELKAVSAIKRNPCLSIRELAGKATTSKTTISRIKAKYGLKSYKKKKVPRREEKQQTRAIQRSRKLYEHILGNSNDCLIMDDETYCQSNFGSLPGNQYYRAIQRGHVSNSFKTIHCEKFPRKYLVWQAICSCGLRSASFVTKGTINSQIYIKECLQKRLKPFISSHNCGTMFWPDLASCHYSKATMGWYISNNVNVVPKDMNPPNCPELRPIERYWAIVKLKLRKTSKEAKNIKDFKIKWTNATKKVASTVVQKLMSKVKRKIREFSRQSSNF